jgi:hypothetical protein
MSKIQRAEKENDKRHRKGEAKHREIIRPTTNDQAYGRVHQEHKAARTIRVESGPRQKEGSKLKEATKKEE